MTSLLAIALLVLFYLQYNKNNRFEARLRDLENKQVIANTAPAPSPVSPLSISPTVAQEVVRNVTASEPLPFVPLKQESNSEFALGSQWFTGGGVIAVLIGIGFFFRYAFTNNLISEPFRVMLGIFAGVIAVSIGMWLKKTYRTYGLSLVGLGLGSIYLSFYAAYAYYALIPALVSFLGMVVIIVVGTLLAVRYDAHQLAAASLAGGYVGAVLFIQPLYSLTVLTALLLLVVFVIAVSYYKKWPMLITLALFSTSGVLLLMFNVHTLSSVVVIALESSIYLLLALSTLLNYANSDTKSMNTESQSFNLYAVPIGAFTIISLVLSNKESWAILAFAIAAFYAVIGMGVRTIAKEHAALNAFAQLCLLIIPGFIALGIGIHFDGYAASMLIAIEGSLVVISGLRLSDRRQYIFGHVLFGASLVTAGVRNLAVLLGTPHSSYENGVMYAVIGLAFGAAWIAHRFVVSVILPKIQTTCMAGDAAFMYGILALAVVCVVNSEFPTLRSGSYLISFLSVLVIVMYALGYHLNERVLRVGSYLIVPIFSTILIINSYIDTNAAPFLNSNVSAMLCIVALSAAMHLAVKRSQGDKSYAVEYEPWRIPILLSANITAFAILTFEIHHYFTAATFGASSQGSYIERISISLFWLIYGVAGLIVGIVKRSTFARQLGAVLFVITTLKICLYDSLALTDLYRFVSFILLGFILLAVGYLYYRFKDRINSFVGLPA